MVLLIGALIGALRAAFPLDLYWGLLNMAAWLGPEVALMASSAFTLFSVLASRPRWPPWVPQVVRELCRSPRRIGGGGFGEVFKAKCRGYGVVAVKVPRVLDDAFYSSFRREAGVWLRISDAPRGVVKLLAVLESRPPALIVELGERSLAGLRPPVSWRTVAEALRDVAYGLAYAHEHGVRHLDVKPSNIVYIRGRGWGLIDWGLARRASSMLPGRGFGTLGFVAPEQLLGGRVSDASDVYGLGATGFYMVTGKHPYDRMEAMQLLEGETMGSRNIFEAYRSVLRDLQERGVNPRFVELLERMLSPTPRMRPSAREVAEELDRLLSQ